MAKEIGAVELVYCTITSIDDGKAGNKSIKFKHLSGKDADHAWTTDKNKYTNIYDDLEPGTSWLIVTKHYAPHRWLWCKGWLLTKKELNLVYKHCGLIPSVEDLEDALTLVKEMRQKPRVKDLSDVLEF